MLYIGFSLLIHMSAQTLILPAFYQKPASPSPLFEASGQELGFMLVFVFSSPSPAVATHYRLTGVDAG